MCLHAGLSRMACASLALLAALMPSLIGAEPAFAAEDKVAAPSIFCSSRAPRLPARRQWLSSGSFHGRQSHMTRAHIVS